MKGAGQYRAAPDSLRIGHLEVRYFTMGLVSQYRLTLLCCLSIDGIDVRLRCVEALLRDPK